MKKSSYRVIIVILCLAVIVAGIYCFSIYQTNKKLVADAAGNDNSSPDDSHGYKGTPQSTQIENAMLDSESVGRQIIEKCRFWVEDRDGWDHIQKLKKITEPNLMPLVELSGIEVGPNVKLQLISESGRRRKTDLLVFVKANDVCVIEGKRGKNLKMSTPKQVGKYKRTYQTYKSLLVVFYIDDLDEKKADRYFAANPDEKSRSYIIDVRKQIAPSKLV